jgi:hypothetical protein
MNWSRIGRNFDFVTAYASEAQFGDELVSLDHGRLSASVSEDSELTVALTDNIGDNKLWLRNSLGETRYPLHVHRHLVAVTTRRDARLGFPVESYYRAARILGRETALPAGSGDKEFRDVRIRVAEFETPASILCQKDLAGVPATYKRAYIDLKATGSSDKTRSYRISIRLVGGTNYLSRLKSLRFNLVSGAEGKPESRVDIALSDPGHHAIGIEIVILNTGSSSEGNTEAASVQPTILYSNGEKKPLTKNLDDLELSEADGLWIDLDNVKGVNELWCDISLLHSRQRVASADFFDFDWLFSAKNESDLLKDTSPSGLNDMVEAQGRLISLTPPIPIVEPKED